MLKKMLFSRWKKQNEQIQNTVLALSIGIAIVVGLQLKSLGQGQVSAIAIIVAFSVRFILDIVFKNLFANSIVGFLKFSYQEMVIALENLFENKSIPFYGTSEEGSHRFEFPEHRLLMTVLPHVVHRPSGKVLRATKMAFHPLTADNRECVAMLTKAIDEMADEKETL